SLLKDLFVIGAEIATKGRFIRKLEERIGISHIRTLEKVIKEIESKNLFEECCFYLPGEDLVSSTLDIARTVARRAERRIVTLKRKGTLKNSDILIYMNRLSDLLYLLARSHEKNPKKLKP
ncbi:MAG: ATP:cob(I)alamin adenosyltransferase, partial [Candidatus Omnitrophica bacterium]|nr:ATP:cob(I)alamin adenosyltransferase [Candidatus Omnitrophota bacterium]